MGFAVAHGILRSKYEQQAQSEIESVKKRFSKRERELKRDISLEKNQQEAKTNAAVSSYREKVKDMGYGQAEGKRDMPHVISPNDFGEEEGYDQVSLTYFSDGTLADDHERPMNDDDILEAIGTEWREILDNPDRADDAVYVRNEVQKVDYEVLCDARTYAQLLKEKPYLKM